MAKERGHTQCVSRSGLDAPYIYIFTALHVVFPVEHGRWYQCQDGKISNDKSFIVFWNITCSVLEYLPVVYGRLLPSQYYK
jgi:hypothetical protein